jgi:hypothetical protein
VITVYTDRHEAHWGKTEFFMGQVVSCLETPQRATAVLEAVKAANLGPIVTPEPLDDVLLARVHTSAYLSFLQTIYPQWTAEHGEIDAFPYVFAVAELQCARPQWRVWANSPPMSAHPSRAAPGPRRRDPQKSRPAAQCSFAADSAQYLLYAALQDTISTAATVS